jgi:hypothetical protein
MRDHSSMSGLRVHCGESRLAHGWRLAAASGVAKDLVAEFIQPAVRAIPGALAARLRPCCVRLPARLKTPSHASQWVETASRLEITVACEGVEAHDVALELLVCVGQALWEALGPSERATYLLVLCEEIVACVTGEIDEDALEEKRRLMGGRSAARSRRRLEEYARASFASTAAEYVHCLWHDVTVRTGPDHLPPRHLRRRLQLLRRWFPPNRGYQLFAEGGAGRASSPAQ